MKYITRWGTIFDLVFRKTFQSATPCRTIKHRKEKRQKMDKFAHFRPHSGIIVTYVVVTLWIFFSR